MTDIEFAIVLCVILAFVSFTAVLFWLAIKVEALTWRDATTEDLLEQLIGQRVDETLTQGCRSLNEVGRS